VKSKLGLPRVKIKIKIDVWGARQVLVAANFKATRESDRRAVIYELTVARRVRVS